MGKTIYRRQFLKGSVLTGGGLIFGTSVFNTNAQQFGQTGANITGTPDKQNPASCHYDPPLALFQPRTVLF